MDSMKMNYRALELAVRGLLTKITNEVGEIESMSLRAPSLPLTQPSSPSLRERDPAGPHAPTHIEEIAQ